ncbi:heme-binding domain-containing protein [Chitinophaga eiseniae]|uniref:Heme-binding domain-containing protein n=1 Tax=Chitinophaga eiseniae TaxID=634771 RepID=A0A847SPI3_9BACT|nr:heme-binding domain-containing protein [Chitinophaga eiseniae]NLR77942.1 heme-binding domain-containing protein [Chitinophaga eiseniae]
MKLIFRLTFFLLLSAMVIIQFIRPVKNQHPGKSADDITRLYPVPSPVLHLLQEACYDCHSNYTRYPWYTNIQPVGWIMAAHTRDGKQELNFSEYGSYSAKRQLNKLKRIREQIATNQMPLRSYTWMHAGARLSNLQKKMIIHWIDDVLQANKGTGY